MIKCIEVKPTAWVDLQVHRQRNEHWIVVEGNASVVNGEQQIKLRASQSSYIPVHRLRLTNPGIADLAMTVEVQSGNYLGEGDIVRFGGQYGRA